MVRSANWPTIPNVHCADVCHSARVRVRVRVS